MRRVKRLMVGAVLAGVALLGIGCREHTVWDHCRSVLADRLTPHAGHTRDVLYDANRGTNWDHCYFRGADGHRHAFEVRIDDHYIIGG